MLKKIGCDRYTDKTKRFVVNASSGRVSGFRPKYHIWDNDMKHKSCYASTLKEAEEIIKALVASEENA